MDLQLPIEPPVSRCGGCAATASMLEPLRRGRCRSCYDAWVRSRPVGLGASCGACGDRRYADLRHYEVGAEGPIPGGRWAVLCFNCAARADGLKPAPRSVEGLKMRLGRDRRWGDRRAEAVGRPTPRAAQERREAVRRAGGRDAMLVDPVDIVDEVIELEADYELITDAQILDEPVTGIHFRLG